ncbi:MAG: hypothetical protein LC745_07970, partial [Planctomycetia bacterium]|nr:hypothetical protein [Planctomycetia bacterium]
MNESAVDRDVLFGLIALRRGVDAAALGAAIDALGAGRGESLGRALVDRGSIREHDFAEIEREVRAQSEAEVAPDATLAAATTLGPATEPLTLASFRDVVIRLHFGEHATPSAELTRADPLTTAAPAPDLESTVAAT